MCHRKHDFQKKKTIFIWIDKHILYNFLFPKKFKKLKSSQQAKILKDLFFSSSWCGTQQHFVFFLCHSGGILNVLYKWYSMKLKSSIFPSNKTLYFPSFGPFNTAFFIQLEEKNKTFWCLKIGQMVINNRCGSNLLTEAVSSEWPDKLKADLSTKALGIVGVDPLML